MTLVGAELAVLVVLGFKYMACWLAGEALFPCTDWETELGPVLSAEAFLSKPIVNKPIPETNQNFPDLYILKDSLTK